RQSRAAPVAPISHSVAMDASRGRRGRPGAATAADPRDRLHGCIERLTRSGRPSLDPADSAELKRLCRSDQQLVDLAHSLLCHRLAQDHAQVRLSAFQIVDLLFRRSRRFRELVLDRFERLVASVLTDNDASSPPPKPVSVFRQLGDIALEAFIDWHEQFSAEQPKLLFAFRFLSQAHASRLSQVRSRLAAAAEQRQAEARRLAEKKRDLLDEARRQFQDEEAELNACLATVANCLELLVPRPEEFDVNSLTSGRVTGDADSIDDAEDDTDADFDGATEDERRRLHGIVSCSATAAAASAASSTSTLQLRLARPTVRETPDNAELVEALATRSGQLRKKLRPRLARWLALADRCGGLQDGSDSSSDQQLRAQLADLLARADRLLGQAASLRILRQPAGDRQPHLSDDVDGDNLTDDDDESTTDFEAVEKKEGFETEAEEAPASASKPSSAASRPAASSTSASTTMAAASSASATESTKSSAVPTVPFGLDLLRWGAKDAAAELSSATIGYRMDDGGHSFGYRPLDGDEAFEISGSRHILTMRTMVYSKPEEPVRWACRHPLPGGGVCARMDRLKCPFHGRILPRDEAGQLTAAAATSASAAEPSGSQSQSQSPKKKAAVKRKKQPQWTADSATADGTGGLVDIRALVDTPRSRLAARVASKAALRRAAEDEEARRRRKMQEKFGDQFQYQFLN
ncbi:hypothetical protein BOX15_Mlig020497g2, partial [Macrostomum lignano]